MKMKLKESVYLLKETDDIYQIVFTSTRKIRRIQFDSLAKTIVEEAKRQEDIEKILERLRDYHPSDIEACLNTLEAIGVLTRYDDRGQNPRFKRQIAFIDELTDSWEETMDLQKRLEGSTITIFGVGGIGTWMVNALYQVGIGHLRIVDPDHVCESNMNRQLYFTSADVGAFKVDAIRQKIPDMDITCYKRFVSAEEDLSDIIDGSTFIVNCADSPSVQETSRVISSYANRWNIPYSIAGGYNMHLGMVGPVIIPGRTACFDCFLEYQKENDPLRGLEKIKDITQTGSLGPIAGAVANLQAMEIFKHIIGKGKVNYNRFAEIDFMDFSVEWREFNKRDGCRTCLKRE